MPMPEQMMTISSADEVNDRDLHFRLQRTEIVTAVTRRCRIANITRKFERSLAFALLTASLLILIAPVVWSQATSGTLTGQVLDPTGAVIPDASVTVTDTQHGTSFTVTTNGEGLFTRTQLANGTYNVKVSATG